MRVTDSIKQNKKLRPYILGVAGGSGSGKTYFARDLYQFLKGQAEIIYQDNFYIDQSKKFDYDGGSVNFDHPDSIDFNLLAERIAQLKEGSPVEIPIYDFATHSRLEKTLTVEPKPIIIVDGILIFHAEQVRRHFDDLVFFDTPEDLRYERRLERDVKERGRTPEGVRNQFLKQVKPMHDQFVEPSKKFATTLVKEISEYSSVFKKYCEKLERILNEKI
jgi:uridine kinase